MESFLDSLIFELDQAQDTLSVKGLNRKLTYTVKDMALELQIFPEFDGDTVKFKTAKPGETGASKVSFQLGSIRDTQIQEVTRPPIKQGEVAIDDMDMPEPEKKELKKLGIQSTEDLRRTLEERQVDLDKVTKGKMSYQNLANMLDPKRSPSPRSQQFSSDSPKPAVPPKSNPIRFRKTPQVRRAKLLDSTEGMLLLLKGDNLAIASSSEFPSALLNQQPLQVLSATAKDLTFQVNQALQKGKSHILQVALDRDALFTLNLQT